MKQYTLFTAALIAGSAFTEGSTESSRVYFGTFAKGEEQGIYQSRLDLQTGQLSSPILAGEAIRPGFLEVHPDGRYLYTVGELVGAKRAGADAVCSFEIMQDSGQLRALNAQPGGGNEPCHLIIDPTGRYVLSAQYGGGSCSVFPILGNGSLGEKTSFYQHEGFSGVNEKRQEAPHAHSVMLDPSGRIALVADLGKDQVLIYRFNAESGMLVPADPEAIDMPPGSGPRHVVFHPTLPFAYVNMELTSSVSALQYDVEATTFQTLETISTLPAGFDGKKAVAEIRMHPEGRFVYISNRGHDSIAIFEVDQKTGRLKRVGHESTRGKFPRNFNIDPSGRYLIVGNQNSNNVVVFRIDPDTGLLTFTGSDIRIPKPVCIAFGVN